MKFHLCIAPEKEENVVVTAHERSELTDRLEQLVLQYSGCDRICVYCDDEVRMLPFSEIECITVIGGKTYAVDIHGKHNRVRQRLYEIEQLVPSCFVRINKSSLANENRLECFKASFSGAIDAVFRCGYREYVSRRCFAEIRRRIEK